MKKLLTVLLGALMAIFSTRANANLAASDRARQEEPVTVQTLIELGICTIDSSTGTYVVNARKLKLYYGRAYIQILSQLANYGSSIQFMSLDQMAMASQEGHGE